MAKELGDLALFLAHVAPFYPDDLAELPDQIGGLLDTNARGLPPGLREHLVQALVLLVNRKIVDLEDTLELFMELQVIGDRAVKKLAFSHIVHSIRRMNQKHKNDSRNRKLQNIVFKFLQAEEESRAKRAFTILCDLHRRRVWFDERTTNVICDACFHPSSRIMIAAISFLLGYENAEQQEDDSDASSSEDEADQNPQILLSKQDVYKANHKGTAASKKKKKAKLQRVIRSMKRKQRKSVGETSSSYYSPLTYLKDAQGFAEKLFSRLQKCNERFEVRMMMLKVIARTIGLHHLVLLNFYPYLQRYVQPHQRDVTTLLAAAVQACHDMVPPDAVEPLFKQIVNQFVHDRSRPEAIAVGLNVVREICMRMPLMMNEDLLQDLVLYKKSHEKAVSIAARSLITLFREICPSLLVKKDRGRPVDPNARPKAFGEIDVACDVSGVELLDENISEGEELDDESEAFDSDDERDLPSPGHGVEENKEVLSKANKLDTNEDAKEEDEISDEDGADEGQDDSDNDTDEIDDELGDDSDMDADTDLSDQDEDDNDELEENMSSTEDEGSDQDKDSDEDDESKGRGSKAQKRKLSDIGELNAADASLRALKRLAGAKKAEVQSDEAGKILSDEDFKRIKELKAKKEAKLALAQHGLIKGGDTKSATFKMPSSDQLSRKRVDPLQLEAHVRRKMSKEERLALVRAGREDRGAYVARAAVKQKKTGGLSNKQKQHKKRMPLAATRAKAARSRQEKKLQRKRSGNQFRGRKAWK